MNLLTFLADATPILAIITGIGSILVGGLQYIFSGGEPSALRKSQQTIINGLVLFAVVLVFGIIIGILIISSNSKISIAFSPLMLAIVIVITLFSTTVIFSYSRIRYQKRRASNYSARIENLTKNLTKASKEVDILLQEMASAVKDQESIVATLKKEHTRIQSEIDALKKAPEANKLFTEYMNTLDKKNTKIQWILFGIGTLIGLASLVIGIISLHH